MGEDEKRLAVGLALLAGAAAVIGPIVEPWNYVLSLLLVGAAVVVLCWPHIRTYWWLSTARTSTPDVAGAAADGQQLKWDDHFGIEYSTQANGVVHMQTYNLSGINISSREITLQDAYFISGKTGDRLSLVVVAGPNDGFLKPSEINPVPPGATVTLRAHFNNPQGFTADEMLARWGPILFYAHYDDEKHQKTFSEAAVAATFAGFRPKQIGPRVTKRSGGSSDG